MSSSEEERVHPVFRPVRRAVNVAAIEAKRQRRVVMIQDGYTEWQMTRAEAQRTTGRVGDGEGVTQSVFRYNAPPQNEPDPEPETMRERVSAMTTPVVLIPPNLRGLLHASILGVTVCRPWAGGGDSL